MKIPALRSAVLACICVLVLSSCSTSKPRSVASVEEVLKSKPQRTYIEQHYREAIRQMKLHKVPASITLAQGILETGSGRSALARYHNNHFGIKCSGSWKGERTYANDDKDNECFRSYENWRESYEDHSLFLGQKRYRKLFRLRTTDYRGWAKGLQKANYATSRTYANHLISIIDKFELYRFDRGEYPKWFFISAKSVGKVLPKNTSLRKIYVSSGLHYIIARERDTYSSIAKEFGLSASKLAKYNDVRKSYPLKKGDIVYLDSKYGVANPKYKYHIVRKGDSMYSISQLYGMHLKSLYILNNKSHEYVPVVGDKLLLR